MAPKESSWARLGMVTSGRSKVDDGLLAFSPHDEPGEAGRTESVLQCRETPVNGVSQLRDDGEVPREAIHVPADDEGSASGEDEVPGLRQVPHTAAIRTCSGLSTIGGGHGAAGTTGPGPAHSRR